MLLGTVELKHSIAANVWFGLVLYRFRFFTLLSMPCHERFRVRYS